MICCTPDNLPIAVTDPFESFRLGDYPYLCPPGPQEGNFFLEMRIPSKFPVWREGMGPAPTHSIVAIKGPPPTSFLARGWYELLGQIPGLRCLDEFLCSWEVGIGEPCCYPRGPAQVDAKLYRSLRVQSMARPGNLVFTLDYISDREGEPA